MPQLLAMAPPMSGEGRIVSWALGFALALILGRRLRGRPTVDRWFLSAASTLLILLGMDLLGVRDPRGLAAFIVGMWGAVIAGTGRRMVADPGRWPHARRLAIASIPIGLGFGLSLFGLWYGLSLPADRRIESAQTSLGDFAGFGLLAGALTASVILAFGLGAGPRREEPSDG